MIRALLDHLLRPYGSLHLADVRLAQKIHTEPALTNTAADGIRLGVLSGYVIIGPDADLYRRIIKAHIERRRIPFHSDLRRVPGFLPNCSGDLLSAHVAWIASGTCGRFPPR